MERRMYEINGSVTPSAKRRKVHVGVTAYYIEKETTKGYTLQQEYPEANEPLTKLKKESVGVVAVEVLPHLFADGTLSLHAKLWAEDKREGKLQILRHLRNTIGIIADHARIGRDAVMDLIDDLTDSGPEVL